MHGFIVSGCAKRWEAGDPAIICGLSGTELCRRIAESCGLTRHWPDPIIRFDTGMSYWAGWILAFCQWKNRCSFSTILEKIKWKDLLRLYPALHTASEEAAYDRIIEMIYGQLEERRISRLQAYRRMLGLSQRQLAEKAGINLRTLQEYEVLRKDLRKASFSTVCTLGEALGCRSEELLEKRCR